MNSRLRYPLQKQQPVRGSSEIFDSNDLISCLKHPEKRFLGCYPVIERSIEYSDGLTATLDVSPAEFLSEGGPLHASVFSRADSKFALSPFGGNER